MDTSGEVKRAMGDSDEAADVRLLMDLVQAAVSPYVTSHPDPRQAMAFAMTALPLYAGTMFANLVFMGEMDAGQQARMAKSASHNFRQGVKVGMRRATRLAHEGGMMGAMQ